MIDVFYNTKDTGKFSFKLSNQDINQMLKNASNNVLPSNAESIYYESKDNHHYFCIDLKPKLFVSTRVVIDTSIVGVTITNEVVLQINKVSMGKLPYIKQANYLNEDFFNKLSEYSLLPIKYIKLEIDEKSQLKNKIKYSNEKFRIEKLYNMHGDYVRDIIKLHQIYTPEFLENIKFHFPWLTDSIIDTLYLTKTHAEDFHKRTLSKFTSDLLKQFDN